jgi:hypothetical protein
MLDTSPAQREVYYGRLRAMSSVERALASKLDA